MASLHESTLTQKVSIMIESIQKDIQKKVIAYYKAKKKSAPAFIPGKSYINYAGRIYDHRELLSLIDSSLEFWLTAGRFAAQFESQLAKRLAVKYALLTNSGSSANLLAVTALTSPLLGDRRLKPGDEVITTACGFPTTVNPILQNNAVPVFVDVSLGTYNIDVKRISKAITQKTKALVVAHTLGNPVDIAAIKRICAAHKLWFIEDNCDALGSLYRGKNTGAFGDIATCSFYPAHHITMGEGGALLTNNAVLKRIIVSLRDWGRDCWCDPGHDNTCSGRFSQKFGNLPYGYDHKYVYSHIGYNLKVTDMQAAIGCAQLNRLDEFIEKRIDNFAYLLRNLKKYEAYLLLPQAEKHARPSWFGFPILVRQTAPFSRAELVAWLEQHKVATRMLFGGNLTNQPAYAASEYRIAGGLCNTDLVMNNLFWIGVYPGITAEKRKYMADVFKAFFKRQ
jgi:CDP-6-deoxy-D-xylo-4-hexulose-3-dehydrase